jgi:hypothetical protein
MESADTDATDAASVANRDLLEFRRTIEMV